MSRSLTTADWHSWHDRYADPESPFSRRLVAVQRQIRLAIQELSEPRVLSIGAGQGHDILGVLMDDPDRPVHVVLVEADERNCRVAAAVAASAGLPDVEVLHADGSLLRTYREAAPADVILVCGVFGHLSEEDTVRTIHALPMLCASGGRVIWTRNRRFTARRVVLDPTPAMRQKFEERGFSELLFETVPETNFAVGVHEWRGDQEPLVDDGRPLFEFQTTL